jgi:hypothetical protein
VKPRSPPRRGAERVPPAVQRRVIAESAAQSRIGVADRPGQFGERPHFRAPQPRRPMPAISCPDIFGCGLVGASTQCPGTRASNSSSSAVSHPPPAIPQSNRSMFRNARRRPSAASAIAAAASIHARSASTGGQNATSTTHRATDPWIARPRAVVRRDYTPSGGSAGPTRGASKWRRGPRLSESARSDL